MKIWKRWSVWTAAVILSGTLVFPAAAQEQADPEPKEELAQLLDGLRVPGSAAEKALREELGLSELARNIKEKGIDASVKMFLTEDTMREMGLIQEGPEDNYGELYFQYSSAQKRWLFGGGLTLSGEGLVDFSLYGDEYILGLAIPQLYEGTAAIRSGSFLDQYQDSALSELLGEVTLPQDIQMAFVPGEESIVSDLIQEYQGWQGKIENAGKGLAEDLQVTKSVDGDQDVYELVLRSEDLEDFYRELMEIYLEGMESLSLLTESDIEEFRQEALGDVLAESFGSSEDDFLTGYVKARDGAAVEMYFEMHDMDRTPQGDEGWETEETFGTASGENTVTEAETIGFLIEMPDSNRMDISVTVGDREAARVEIRSLSDGDSASDTIWIYTREEEAEEFWPSCQVVDYFSRQTGEYSRGFTFWNEGGDTMYMDAGCVFSEVVPGESFRCTVESAAAQMYGDSLGAGMELRVKAGDTQVAPPDVLRMPMEMSRGGLSGWFTEIGVNAEALQALLEGDSSSGQEYEEIETEMQGQL